VRPDSREGVTKIQDKEGKIRQWTGQVAAELKATPGPLVRALAPIFPFLVEGKVGGTAGGTHGTTTENVTTVELHAIDNPQRQLIHLAIHYLVNLRDRLFFPATPLETRWRDPAVISMLPRALVFLDLPGQVEAEQAGLPETKLIPTAAEFESGAIVSLYQ